uniref:C-C chemokine receptor-like 2 isoform X1 n=3 Tax=Castor canadensis TaxID=51338 RepID=A0A8B7VT72_CASCN|nr:C-C chemokine receptor-like 2 isoform X1 [Castor canadensis]
MAAVFTIAKLWKQLRCLQLASGSRKCALCTGDASHGFTFANICLYPSRGKHLSLPQETTSLDSLTMTNYTEAPEDEYDVLIVGDLDFSEPEQCDKHATNVLSAQQVLQLCSTVFVIGLLNILVVFILIKYKGLKHVGNIYFLNLALSNLCFLLPLPLWAHMASHGTSLIHPTCKILAGLHSIALYSEALFNVLLTVQRYQVFSHLRWLSLALQTVPGGVITSVLAWVIATVVTLPELVFYQLQTEGHEDKCSFHTPHFLPAEETSLKSFLTLKTNILVLVFPLFTFLFCYVQIRKPRRLGEQQFELFKIVFAIMVIFLLMWAPYSIVLCLSTFQERLSLQDCESSYKLDRSVQITKIIGVTHCCVNPLLYLLLDKEFRKYLYSLFPGCNNEPSVDSDQDPSREDHDHSTKL